MTLTYRLRFGWPNWNYPHHRKTDLTFVHEGKRTTLKELSKATGISYDTLYYRLQFKRMSGDDLVAPPNKNRSRTVKDS